LGPLEEKAATLGAGRAPRTVFAPNILDTGLLFSISQDEILNFGEWQ